MKTLNPAAPAILALAIALMLAAGCKEETMCGNEKYNSEKQFCYDNAVYDRCGGVSEYNALKLFCKDGRTYEKCGSHEYNLETQFCAGNELYDKCNGENYRPETQECIDGEITRIGSDDNEIIEKVMEEIVFDYGKVSHKGKTYKTIKIGSQTWMAEDLGSYSWAVAMDIDTAFNSKDWNESQGKRRGICPEGWHLPSKKEWEILIDYAGGEVKGISPGVDLYNLDKHGFNKDSKIYWTSSVMPIENAMESAVVTTCEIDIFFTRHTENAVRCVMDN